MVQFFYLQQYYKTFFSSDQVISDFPLSILGKTFLLILSYCAQNRTQHNNIYNIYRGATTHIIIAHLFFSLFNSNCTPKNLFQLVYYISYPLPCLNALCGIKLFKHSIILLDDAQKGGGLVAIDAAKFGNQSNCEDNPLSNFCFSHEKKILIFKNCIVRLKSEMLLNLLSEIKIRTIDI